MDIIFGIVLEDGQFKAYQLSELEGTDVYISYVVMCTIAQINNIVRMLNNVKKEAKL